MKRIIIVTLLLGMVGVTLLTGCSAAKTAQQQTSDNTPVTATQAAEITQPVGAKNMNVKYKTVTEEEDWGPAITKVILELGTSIDASSLTKDTFSVSSERKYQGFTKADEIKKRTVTDAYVSDATGNKVSDGDCITLEMKIGPELVEGSPFNYDFASGFNTFVDTSYIISINQGQKLLNGAGQEISMAKTDATMSDGDINELVDKFDTSGSYDYQRTDGTITLKYASYNPKKSMEKQSMPLIIWLHGAGEGGTDPKIALMGNKVVSLASAAIQNCFGENGAQVLVPQAPTMWMDYDGKGTYNTSQQVIDICDGKSYYTEALKGLIDDYVSKHPELDTKRIYIGGCSNGGYMTVNMIINYPDYFAAAYPVCEAYSVKWLTDKRINAIKNIPIWITAAKTDTTVNIYAGDTPRDDYSNALDSRLKAVGAKDVHFSLFDKVVDTSGLYYKSDNKTPYEYNGHWSWIYTLNNECKDTINGAETTIFEWLSAQAK